jgi:hypothetical protein
MITLSDALYILKFFDIVMASMMYVMAYPCLQFKFHCKYFAIFLLIRVRHIEFQNIKDNCLRDKPDIKQVYLMVSTNGTTIQHNGDIIKY